MMGVMTLAMSLFSIVPMSISLTNRIYLSRVIVYMLGRYGRPTGDEEYDKEQQPFEPMEFWGTVSDVFKKDGLDELPEEDDSRVVRLATAMLIFFIVCIILLIVYLACRYLTKFLYQATKIKGSNCPNKVFHLPKQTGRTFCLCVSM